MPLFKKIDYFSTSLEQEISSSFQQHSLLATGSIQLNLASSPSQIEPTLYRCFLNIPRTPC